MSSSLPPLLKETLNSVGSSIACISSKDHSILFANSSFENLTLKESKSLEGSSFFDLFIKKDKDQISNLLNLQPIQSDTLLFDHDFTIRRRSRNLQNISIALKKTNTDNLIIATIIDNTPRKEIEENLEKAYSQLIETSKFSALAEMSSGIAHEINNPLAIIHGLGEKLKILDKRNLLNSKEVEKISTSLQTSSKRISSILKDLKLLSHSHDKHEFELTNVKQVMEKTLAFCKEKYANSGVSLSVNNIPEELEVLCHPGQIYQVLLNLLSNAFFAVKENPNNTEPWIKVEIIDNKTDITFSIIDNGFGIPNKLKKKIMLPFFTTKGTSNTGLGLSIAKGILKNHNGHLKLDQVSKHTKFVASIEKNL